MDQFETITYMPYGLNEAGGGMLRVPEQWSSDANGDGTKGQKLAPGNYTMLFEWRWPRDQPGPAFMIPFNGTYSPKEGRVLKEGENIADPDGFQVSIEETPDFLYAHCMDIEITDDKPEKYGFNGWTDFGKDGLPTGGQSAADQLNCNANSMVWDRKVPLDWKHYDTPWVDQCADITKLPLRLTDVPTKCTSGCPVDWKPTSNSTYADMWSLDCIDKDCYQQDMCERVGCSWSASDKTCGGKPSAALNNPEKTWSDFDNYWQCLEMGGKWTPDKSVESDALQSKIQGTCANPNAGGDPSTDFEAVQCFDMNNNYDDCIAFKGVNDIAPICNYNNATNTCFTSPPVIKAPDSCLSDELRWDSQLCICMGCDVDPVEGKCMAPSPMSVPVLPSGGFAQCYDVNTNDCLPSLISKTAKKDKDQCQALGCPWFAATDVPHCTSCSGVDVSTKDGAALCSSAPGCKVVNATSTKAAFCTYQSYNADNFAPQSCDDPDVSEASCKRASKFCKWDSASGKCDYLAPTTVPECNFDTIDQIEKYSIESCANHGCVMTGQCLAPTPCKDQTSQMDCLANSVKWVPTNSTGLTADLIVNGPAVNEQTGMTMQYCKWTTDEKDNDKQSSVGRCYDSRDKAEIHSCDYYTSAGKETCEASSGMRFGKCAWSDEHNVCKNDIPCSMNTAMVYPEGGENDCNYCVAKGYDYSWLPSQAKCVCNQHDGCLNPHGSEKAATCAAAQDSRWQCEQGTSAGDYCWWQTTLQKSLCADRVTTCNEATAKDQCAAGTKTGGLCKVVAGADSSSWTCADNGQDARPEKCADATTEPICKAGTKHSDKCSWNNGKCGAYTPVNPPPDNPTLAKCSDSTSSLTCTTSTTEGVCSWDSTTNTCNGPKSCKDISENGGCAADSRCHWFTDHCDFKCSHWQQQDQCSSESWGKCVWSSEGFGKCRPAKCSTLTDCSSATSSEMCTVTKAGVLCSWDEASSTCGNASISKCSDAILPKDCTSYGGETCYWDATNASCSTTKPQEDGCSAATGAADCTLQTEHGHVCVWHASTNTCDINPIHECADFGLQNSCTYVLSTDNVKTDCFWDASDTSNKFCRNKECSDITEESSCEDRLGHGVFVNEQQCEWDADSQKCGEDSCSKPTTCGEACTKLQCQSVEGQTCSWTGPNNAYDTNGQYCKKSTQPPVDPFTKCEAITSNTDCIAQLEDHGCIWTMGGNCVDQTIVRCETIDASVAGFDCTKATATDGVCSAGGANNSCFSSCSAIKEGPVCVSNFVWTADGGAANNCAWTSDNTCVEVASVNCADIASEISFWGGDTETFDCTKATGKDGQCAADDGNKVCKLASGGGGSDSGGGSSPSSDCVGPAAHVGFCDTAATKDHGYMTGIDPSEKKKACEACCSLTWNEHNGKCEPNP